MASYATGLGMWRIKGRQGSGIVKRVCISQCLQDILTDTFGNYLDRMMILSNTLFHNTVHLNDLTTTQSK